MMISDSLALATRLARQSDRLGRRIKLVDARVRRIQSARLLSGSAFAVALLLAAIRPGWQIPAPAAAVFAPFFAYLVVLSRHWSAFHGKLVRLQAFYERQKARLLGLSPVAPGSNFDHDSYGADLNFFGSHSLWTLLDETLSDAGSEKLKSWITGPVQAREAIALRQETVRSLRKDAWFYTRLTLVADRVEFRQSSQQILDFLKRAKASSNFSFKYAADVVIWLAWLSSIIFADHLGAGSRAITGGLYFLFLGANFGLIGRAGDIFKNGVGVSHHLDLLFPVFSSLEKRTSTSAVLRGLAPVTSSAGPSREARSLGFAVGILSLSANPIVHLAINTVVPWTATGVLLLERSRKKLDASFETCLKELAHLEALFSLVIFDRYQTQIYPSLDAVKFSASQLYHPLIRRDKVVANDFSFSREKSLGLLTGSNMSGKSTFLRTIGLNQALANMGAPVFADKFATRPLTIESCIEVSDSLRDGFSYFYAEVRRLKALLDSARNGQVLFLIDEIFRGTNNRERQIGSRAVIQALAKASTSEGFISTHDLELTALEATEPAVVNLHFREHITNGTMTFTYLLQPGASPTTNALRIMQFEGLPVDASGANA